MNRECNGEYFEVIGLKLYRCQKDGAVVNAMAVTCLNCNRPIDGTIAKVTRIREIRQIQIDGDAEWHTVEVINER
jgi:hypothetical protein